MSKFMRFHYPRLPYVVIWNTVLTVVVAPNTVASDGALLDVPKAAPAPTTGRSQRFQTPTPTAATLARLATLPVG